jgi:DNA invertase Pin-like site-specific DNA recombinase/peptidoglycan hydrolase-like protein with peptidoglycan-binding domain
MTTQLVAIGGRTRTVTALLALVAAAVLLTAVAPATARAATKQTPVLAQGAGMGSTPSAAVRRVQQALRSKGYSLGPPGVDGRFGPLTAAAVRNLQADYGLLVDGIVGPKTRKLVRLIDRRTKQPSQSRDTGKQSKPSKTKSDTGSTQQPQPQPEPQPQPQPQPRATADGGGNTAAWLFAIALIAAIAAFGGALLKWRSKAPRQQPAPPAAIAPLAHELYVEGRSKDERIGEFRGNAFATTVTDPPVGGTSRAQTWYLVDDPRKRAPVWVNGDEIRRSPSKLAAGEPVIGYVTVAPEGERADADAAVHEIERACEQAGWVLAEVVTDRENGRGLERPGLAYALEQIAAGTARGLVVTDLRRLSRSINDVGTLMEWFRDAQAALVALDLGVDTSTPSGHDVAATLITLGGWERERIARRTRSGLAEVRASGRPTGRPAVSDKPDLVERITAMRNANMTLQAIADQFNAEGVPTLRGGAMWRPSSVQAALGYRRPGTRNPRDQLPTLEDRA